MPVTRWRIVASLITASTLKIYTRLDIVLRAVYEPTIKLAVHCMSCRRSVFAKVNVNLNKFCFRQFN